VLDEEVLHELDVALALDLLFHLEGFGQDLVGERSPTRLRRARPQDDDRALRRLHHRALSRGRATSHET